MRIEREWQGLSAVRRPLSLAIGFLDGLHLGHQRILRRVRDAAEGEDGEGWALTFEPHPLKIIRPAAAPPLLLTPAQKIEHLAAAGLDGCLILPFTAEFAALEPEIFVAELVRHAPTLRRVAVGPNWTFGHQARGTPDLLRALAAQHGFIADVAEPVMLDGAPVSSTRVRQAVRAGDLPRARRLLGYPPALVGRVVPGRQIGRKWGFPTANLLPENELLPPPGIYAARAKLDGARHDAAVYIGHRPTFGDTPASVIEAHLLDFQGDLYGAPMELTFYERLRSDQRFADPAALVRQIERDIAAARAVLRGIPADG